MIRLKTSSIQRALLGTLLAASAAIMTTPTAAYSDMVTDWNEIAIQTFPPTVLGPTQARFLGIVHAAIYDAINAIMLGTTPKGDAYRASELNAMARDAGVRGATVTSLTAGPESLVTFER